MPRFGIAGLVMVALATGPAVAQPSSEKPGEGVICAWAIMTTMAEVGDRCFPGEDPDYQRELHSAVSRLDAYVAKNSKRTPAEIQAFKRQQAHVGAPVEAICHGDVVEMYRALHKRGAPSVRAIVDQVAAHDGEPTWGTCL